MFVRLQLKGVIVDDSLYQLFEATVHFDTELQEFRTHGGVIKGKDKQHREVTVPTVMWVKALDVLLDRLQVCGADLSTVAAVSGSGQVNNVFCYLFIFIFSRGRRVYHLLQTVFKTNNKQRNFAWKKKTD